MHTDAELHRLVDGAARILCGYRRLHRDRALHGIHRAGEVGDNAIASSIEDAAAMRPISPSTMARQAFSRVSVPTSSRAISRP
jgi:hypothetical protein